MISIYLGKGMALVVALVLTAVTTFPTHAEAITTSLRLVVPFNTVVPTCTNEGDVFVSGELLIVFHATTDPAGGYHETTTVVPRHIEGVGFLSGIPYIVIFGNTTRVTTTVQGSDLQIKSTVRMNVVSQGGSDNFLLTVVTYVVISPSGEQTVLVNHFTTECVG